jgi:hypothetical protein
VLCLLAGAVCAADAQPTVRLARLPAGGIQPQAVTDRDGTAHLVYFQGEPMAGDLFYVRWRPEITSFTPPVRVNHRPRTAVAVGTTRGAQLTAGRRGRLHVVWNGSGETKAEGHEAAPLWYTCTNDAGGFEPEGTGWERGGAVAWQVSDRHGLPAPVKSRADGLPVGGLVAAVAQSDGRLVLVF